MKCRLFLRASVRFLTHPKWLSLAVLPVVMSAATISSSATCGSSVTSSAGSYVQCSSGLDYATASGSLATFGDTVILSASAYSSYAYGPSFPANPQGGAAAYTNISDMFTSGGGARPGYAEVVFSNITISQSNLNSTSADLTISLNGNSIYNCHVAGGGFSSCPTTTILAPVELGLPFTLVMNDASYSPAGSFSGGIAAEIVVSLREADGPTASNVREVSAAPEPTVWALMTLGLCVMASRIRAQMKRL